MKPKMYRHVQPRQVVPLRNEQVRRVQHQDIQHQGIQDQAREEIATFLLALDSYAARAAKEPRLTFQQHLSNVFEARQDCRFSRR